MSDLDIEIKLDPNQAVTGAKAVSGELAKTEAAAAKAQSTCKNLSDVFKRIGADQQRAAGEASRLRGAIGSLATNFQQLANQMRADMLKPVANGFEKVAQAIQLEKNALVSIRGDLDQYAKEVAAIDLLHKKGAISAQEHGDAIAAAGKRTGVAKQDSPSFGGEVASNLGGQVAGLVGPAALIGAVAQSADEMRKYRDELVETTNHLVKFYGSFDDASAHIGKFKDLSGQLRESLGDSVRAYDAVEGASQKLYLTQQQQLSITKNLGQLMKEDGDSIQSVVPVMERLEAAIDRNQISGGELAKIMKQYPELADVWKKEFGATRNELIKFADSGKLVEMGLGRLVTGLAPATDATQKFATMQVTAREADALHLTFMERLEASFGQMPPVIEDATEAGNNWAESLAQQGLQGKKVSDQIDKINEGMQGQIALQKILTGMAITKNAVTDPILLVDQLSGQGDARALGKKKQMLVDFRKAVENDTNMPSLDKALKLDEIDRAMENLTGGMKDMSSVIDAQKKKWEELQQARVAAWKPITDQLMASGRAMPMGIEAHAWKDEQRGQMHDNLAQDFGSDVDQTLPASPSNLTEDLSKLDASKLAENTAKWKKELYGTADGYAEINKVGTTAMDSLGASIEQMTTSGKFSFSEMVDSMMADLARLAEQQLFKQLISGLGSLGSSTTLAPGVVPIPGGAGFSTGGDASMTSSGLQRRYPGAATGADWMVPGAGGTDSRLIGMRVTPGESIHVRTPGQREAAGGGGGGGAAPVTVINNNDPRSIAMGMSGPEGGRVIYNWIRQNAPAVKALIGGR
jgi:tape measure domain-containing protein